MNSRIAATNSGQHLTNLGPRVRSLSHSSPLCLAWKSRGTRGTLPSPRASARYTTAPPPSDAYADLEREGIHLRDVVLHREARLRQRKRRADRALGAEHVLVVQIHDGRLLVGASQICGDTGVR